MHFRGIGPFRKKEYPFRFGRKGKKTFAASIIAATFMSFVGASGAQSPSMDAAEMHHSVKACPPIPNPDALASLAQECAKDLTLDANCRAYAKDGNAEYVIVKDCSANKPAGYLLIPVQPVTGIEDSRIFSPPLANLWEDAWLWSHQYPGRGARIGLAVNAKNGRSQNQLHIHIACVLPQVSKALDAADIPLYPAKAVALALGPRRNVYQAVKVPSLVEENSPFRIIHIFPGAPEDMKDQSIAVIESPKPQEYYVLDTASHGENRGHAEELLEQGCP